MKPQRTRIDFGGRAARRRLVAEMAAAKPARQGIRPHRATVALVIFLAILSAALHGGTVRGSFANGSGLVGGGSLRAVRPKGPSREVDDMRARRWMAAALVGLAATASAHGADRPVPSKEYPTIQAAIDASVDGDIIVLAAGTFLESCIVQGKSLAFRGAGAEATTWIAPAKQRCLWVPFLDDKAISIADIHFTGFDMPYNAAAVDLESTGAHRISRCRFTGCGYFPLELFGGGSIVEDCDFTSNTGRGISMTIPQGQTGIEQRIVRCRFIDNRNNFDIGSSAVTVYNATVRIEECLFARNNFPANSGVAIEINSPGSLLLVNSTFCESPGVSAIAGGWTDGGGNVFTESPCTPPCPADLVTDGSVNGADLATVLVYWGTSGSQYPGVDIDGNGIVDASDLATVLAAWGPCPQ